ncbi:hypothetical protein ACIA8I_39270 [Streptomyces rishiriensis]|uniref:hypothetical protein n=1 Tax=Streptomyces rishiriensis TaxID=68264 RepID=UPI003794418A
MTMGGGVMRMLAALDLATGKICYRIRQHKRWREFLGLLKILRSRWPEEKLYVVLGNFSPHKHAEDHEWAADNDVELVFLVTCGSRLNWIESKFAALRFFALDGTAPRPRGVERRHRRLHPLAQRPQLAQEQLRS